MASRIGEVGNDEARPTPGGGTMVRRGDIVLSLFIGITLLASTAVAQGHPLSISGQFMIFADTDSSGCPDANDAGCSATLFGSTTTVPGDTLEVNCDQSLSQGMSNQVHGATGSQFYTFLVDAFDLMAMNSAVHQTGGSVTQMRNFVSGSASFADGTGTVEVVDRFGTSFAHVCSENGPVVEVHPAGGPTLLRNLQLVDCSGCPSNTCSSNTTSPDFLRAPSVPLPSQNGGLIFRDFYVPIMDNKITFGVDDPPMTFKEIALSQLRPCNAPAPTLTDAGLFVVGLSLLVMGTWLAGRRRTFAQAIPLP
jgi:hypothetical protein